MLPLSRRYATRLTIVLVFTLALNSLGWAAQMNHCGSIKSEQAAHLRVDQHRYQSVSNPPSDEHDAIAGKHCGHNSAHYTGLVRAWVGFSSATVLRTVRHDASHYISLLFPPDLEPPIA